MWFKAFKKLGKDNTTIHAAEERNPPASDSRIKGRKQAVIVSRNGPFVVRVERPQNLWVTYRVINQVYKCSGHNVIPATVTDDDQGRCTHHLCQGTRKLWPGMRQLRRGVQCVGVAPVTVQMDNMGTVGSCLSQPPVTVEHGSVVPPTVFGDAHLDQRIEVGRQYSTAKGIGACDK